MSWWKESPTAGTFPAGWPEKLRELGWGPSILSQWEGPREWRFQLSMWPLTHLSGPLSSGAGCVAGFPEPHKQKGELGGRVGWLKESPAAGTLPTGAGYVSGFQGTHR